MSFSNKTPATSLQLLQSKHKKGHSPTSSEDPPSFVSATTAALPSNNNNNNIIIDANDTTPDIECNKEGTTTSVSTLTPILIRRRTVQGVQVPSTGTTTSTLPSGAVKTTVDCDPIVFIDDCEVIGSNTSDTSKTRRRSTFYVPLNSHQSSNPTATADSADDSLDLSACSLDWSLNDSLSSELEDDKRQTTITVDKNKKSTTSINGTQLTPTLHRLEITVNGETRRDRKDSEYEQDSKQSTPIKSYGKSRSRTNILNLTERISLSPAVSPLKEKSKTLPQSLTNSPVAGGSSSCFPAKNSFLLKSSPKISSMATGQVMITASPSPPPQVIPLTAKSPRKSLSFIRRSHSTKVSRSSSLLRSFTSKNSESGTNGQGQDQGEQGGEVPPRMVGLNAELLERLYKISVPGDFDESLRRIFFKDREREEHERITRKGAETGGSFGAGGGGGNTSYGSCIGGSGKRRPFGGVERDEEEAVHSGMMIINSLMCYLLL